MCWGALETGWNACWRLVSITDWVGVTIFTPEQWHKLTVAFTLVVLIILLWMLVAATSRSFIWVRRQGSWGGVLGYGFALSVATHRSLELLRELLSRRVLSLQGQVEMPT